MACIRPPAFKENASDISLMDKNINTKELEEGKSHHDPERQFPTVLNVNAILRAARSAHVIVFVLFDSLLLLHADE